MNPTNEGGEVRKLSNFRILRDLRKWESQLWETGQNSETRSSLREERLNR